MNNKNIVVPLLELKELCFEIEAVDVVESSFRYLKYPTNPHLDDSTTDVFLEIHASGTADYKAEFDGHKLSVRYEWFTNYNKENDEVRMDLSIQDDVYTLIDCNFSIYDEECEEIEEVGHFTIQNNASCFENCTSDVVSLVGSTHGKFFN